MQTLIVNRLLDELAKAFNTSAQAEWLLWAIGYPQGRRPGFSGAPIEFWTTACKDLETGIINDGFELLLAAAAGRFPGNPAFAPFAILRRPHNEVLLDEIARVAPDEVTAYILLAALGFPNAELPRFSQTQSPLHFWRIVFEQIENGRIACGLGALATQAARRFPGNATLRRLAAQPEPTAAPATLGEVVASGYDVFVSYSSRDRQIVSDLAEAIRSAGLRVWFDEWSLPLGKPFAREIQSILTRVPAVVVCYGTEGYGPWQEAEVEAVFDRSFRGDCLVIPVMLSGVRSHDLPPFLGRLHGLHVHGPIPGEEAEHLVDRLKVTIGTAKQA
jgi:hypothetical protein